MSKKNDSDTILEKAKKNADKFLENFNLNGNYDLKKIEKALAGRTFRGKPVTIKVVEGPREADAILAPIVKKDPDLRPWDCIWDYYCMAFYESAYKSDPKLFEDNNDPNFTDTKEFISQSMFNAFKNGLGYYIGLGEFAVAVARPQVKKDPEGRIHAENGPAIIWGQDALFYWHGTQVEKDWIMAKDKVDPKLCLTWANVEQRRALCEIIGWAKVLDQLSAKKIQEDKYGVLLEVQLPGATQKDRFVKVKCGTGRTFVLPVSATAKTAHEAVAESYSVPKELYNPETRT